MSDENLIKLPEPQDSLILISSINNSNDVASNHHQTKTLSLQEKIMQNGLQNTIVEMTQNSSSSSFLENTTLSQEQEVFENLSFIHQEEESNNPINEQEAVELAIASEEEIPSPWIDVMTMTAEPALRTEESWPELNAFPTAVHSLVDLVGPEPYPLELETERNVNQTLMDNVNIVINEAPSEQIILNSTSVCNSTNQSNISMETFPIKELTNHRRNILEKITADADICHCENCDCSETKNCHNCLSTSLASTTLSSSSSLSSSVENFDNPSELLPNLVGKCPSDQTKNCDSSCAVVICVKTLQQLQTVLNTCCKVTSNCAVACTRGELFSGHNMTLLTTQLAGNH